MTFAGARWARVLAPPIASVACLASGACGHGASTARDARDPTARGLLAAAPRYADEGHAFVLATTDVPRGRGVREGPDGAHVLGAACAVEEARGPDLDLTTNDYAFVGVAIDATLVSADADVAPLLARGARTVRLVAMAFAHDRAPPRRLAAGPAVDASLARCACADATHVVGETRWGALVSYDAPAPASPSGPVRAIDLARRLLADPSVHVQVTRVGAMNLYGFAPFVAGHASPPLVMRVVQAAPVAYALRPVAELCPGGLPAPDISPSPVDFGVAPYGTEARRTVRITNRATLDLDAVVGPRTFRLPARGAIELPLAWTPDGDAWRCESQTRDEAIAFVPTARSSVAPVHEATAHVLETVRTGRPSVQRAEHVEPPARAAQAASASRGEPVAQTWSCPPDFVPASCRIERPACGGRPCASAKAETVAGGCRFRCAGAGGAPCRFDAVMECRLACPDGRPD